MIMCEAQIISNETGRQGEKSVWASHRSPAGFISGDPQMKLIPLTQGKFAIVDDKDFDRLNQYKWCAHKRGGTYYAERMKRIGDRRITIFMHREILGVLPGVEIDHRIGNGLDNRSRNIRICTRSDNQCNKKKGQRQTTSRFKGVSWAKDRNKWRVWIQINGKSKYLGCFDSEVEAARKYDEEANQLFGKFARMNFQ